MKVINQSTLMTMQQGKGCQYGWMHDATTTAAPPPMAQVDCFFHVQKHSN